MSHRRLRLEPLEDRRLLAVLEFDIQLRADSGGNPAEVIDRAQVGQSFFIEVLARDTRGPSDPGETPAGIVSLAVNLYWNPQVVRFIGPSPDADGGHNPGQANVEVPAGNRLVTDHFDLQRFLDDFEQGGGRFEELRGATAQASRAIGRTGFDTFSLLHVEAVGAAVAMPFAVELARTPGFADGDALTNPDLATNPVVFREAVRVQAQVSGRTLDLTEGQPAGTGLAGWQVRAYRDTDGDGLLDQAEFDAGAVQTATTDGVGAYAFLLDTGPADSGDPGSAGTPARYLIVEVLPTGWNQTYPADAVVATGLSTGSVVLGPRGYAPTIDVGTPNQQHADFGNAALPSPGAIRGFKWHDRDGDGTWDTGEPGLNGWTVFLDLDNDGQPDPGEPARVTANNGQNDGAFVFGDLAAGNYVVREVVQTGATQTSPAAPNTSWAITLAAGQTVAGTFGTAGQPNFGNRLTDDTPPTGAIRGFKWHDRDGDGVWDNGEPGLNGWTVFLDLDNDGQPDPGEPARGTANNGQNDGAYVFGDLAAGNYVVREVVQTGATQTSPAAPNTSWAITLAAGQTVAGTFGTAGQPNFGNRLTDDTPPTGAIRGFKWHDQDGDGTWDAGEPGLNGWTVFLDLDNDGQPDPGEPARVTANNGQNDGAYVFEELEPGTYIVREILQDGWQQTFPTPPSTFWQIVLTAGQTMAGAFGTAQQPNFGNREIPPASLGGFVYADSDGDGTRDADDNGTPAEIGLPNVQIALFRREGTAADAPYVFQRTTTTDPDGWYTFEGLDPGTYQLVEQQPENFLDRGETRGVVLPAGDARGTVEQDQFSGITLAAGEAGIDYNFGEVLSARAINKRLYLASPPSNREFLASRLGLTARTVLGTAGDDTIAVAADAGGVSVTVNGATQRFAAAEVDLVSVDALAGRDTVAVDGAAAGDLAHAWPGRATLRSSDRYDSVGYALEVLGAETVETDAADAGLLAVLRDSTRADTLDAAGDTASLDYDDLSMLAEALSFGRVRAISRAGGADAATTQPIDFLLELLGDWTP